MRPQSERLTDDEPQQRLLLQSCSGLRCHPASFTMVLWLKWGREARLTGAQRVKSTITGDSWPRNPCNEGARSISHDRRHRCITMQANCSDRDPSLFPLRLNSPEFSRHRRCVIHAWNMLTCKVVAILSPPGVLTILTGARLWSVPCRA